MPKLCSTAPWTTSEHNHRFVEIIQAQATRLTNIASDLLTISELESNHAAPAPKPVSIRAALESALRTVESGARVRGVHLLCEELDDLQVLGNELQLEQVFVNLLDNAVKFNRPNGEVRVEAHAKDGTRPRSSSPIPASESPPKICPESSSASTASTKPARAKWAALAWAFPSSSM